MAPSGGSAPVSALVARIAHASVEGCAFCWTRDGFRAFLLLHSAALVWALGPRQAVGLGLQCGLACSAVRFGVVLCSNSGRKGGKRLESIWDFEPPGDLGASGAWKVLKELALTMTMGADSHQELQGLPPIPLPELVVRLTLLYRHMQQHPAADELSAADRVGDVDRALVDELCKWLFLADQSYDCGTEDNLADALQELGYSLHWAKLEATWAAHCPAFFVATHPEARELVVTIRGTAQIEDVVTDLTATPTEFGDSGHLVHGGMHASAVWLFGRLCPLIQGVQEAGYSTTLVGHSLGAGAAALLAMMLEGAGVRDVRCFAFATPNCADLHLARSCEGYVTSVVFRDDVVTRFSPEALAGLHRQLRELDVEAARREAREGDAWLLRFLPCLASATAAAGPQQQRDGAEAAAAGEAEKTSQEEQRKKSYRPHIPGRVVYIYRRQAAQGEEQPQEHELALVETTCPALRCIRLSERVVADHLIDSYFEGFGRPNPSKERAKRLEAEARAAEEQASEADQGSDAGGEEQDGGELRPKQRSAQDRDKDGKDRLRSWAAKLGLVG